MVKLRVRLPELKVFYEVIARKKILKILRKITFLAKLQPRLPTLLQKDFIGHLGNSRDYTKPAMSYNLFLFHFSF